MDVINREIIAALKRNSRVGWGQLSDQLGISRQALRKRIERLEYTGQILAYTIITAHKDDSGSGNADKDTNAVRAFLNIRFASGNDCFNLSELLSTYNNIEGMWAMTGNWDMLLLVKAQKMEQISEIREIIVATGGIDEIKTNVVLNDLLHDQED